jgi:hypothetical protein
MMRISVVLYLATAAGLIFSGYVTDNFGWRLIFLPNVLFAAVAIQLLLRHFPEVPRPADVRATGVDRLGILLLGTALVSLQIVFSRGEIDDWFRSARIQLLTWIGLSALVLFVAWQLSSRNAAPLLQLSLLADRNLLAASSPRIVRRHHPIWQHLRIAAIPPQRLPQSAECDSDRPHHERLRLDCSSDQAIGLVGDSAVRPTQGDDLRLHDAGPVDAALRTADDDRHA